MGAAAGCKGWGKTESMGTGGTLAILSPPAGFQQAWTHFLACTARCASSVPAGLMQTHARVWPRGFSGHRYTCDRRRVHVCVYLWYSRSSGVGGVGVGGWSGTKEGVRCGWVSGAQEQSPEGAVRRAVCEGVSG